CRTGDQRNFALQFLFLHDYHPWSCSRAACMDAGSVMAKPTISLSMRLVRPLSTLPGPHSTTCVMPCAFMARMVSTQRTGCQAWRTSAALMAAGSDTTDTSTLLITGTEGALITTPSSAACN